MARPFLTPIVLPGDATQALQAATKQQVDVKADDTAVVHLTGTETINGAKTFGTAPQVPVGSLLANPVRRDDTRLTDARTPTVHASTHASGGSDVVTPTAIGAATSGHTHPPAAVYATPRTASASSSYTADGTLAGDIQLTCTGNTVITPSGTPNGRMMIVEALASGGQRTPSVPSTVMLTTGITSRSLTVPQDKVGLFGLRYSTLAGTWLLAAASVET